MFIVGREKELELLKKIYDSKKPELVIVRGRRRVGKTYLIDNAYRNYFIFKHTGISSSELEKDEDTMLQQQLNFFVQSLKRHGLVCEEKINNWADAFFALEQLINRHSEENRCVIFIDELPWLDTPKSQFLAAFSNFWNSFASKKDNLVVVVSGSTNSWMDDVFFNSYGGFYHRATREITLAPFSLQETKDYLTHNGFVLSDYEVIRTYMIFGGIPFYLEQLDSSYPIGKNVDLLFFSNTGILKNEFDLLFNSTFKNSEKAKSVVKLLAKKRVGYTMEDISEHTAISNGGGLTNILNALVSSNIIIKYSPINENKNVTYYKLIDPFVLFYLKFIANNKTLDPSYWQDNQFSQSVIVNNGFAFENLVFYHVERIKSALGIVGMTMDVLGYKDDDQSAKSSQIDLLLFRKDNVVDMCEIKYYNDEFVLYSDYLQNLKNKEKTLVKKLKKRQVVEHVLITPFGLKQNEYSGYFTKVITLKDLFRVGNKL